jgi:hypothetical protein
MKGLFLVRELLENKQWSINIAEDVTCKIIILLILAFNLNKGFKAGKLFQVHCLVEILKSVTIKEWHMI